MDERREQELKVLRLAIINVSICLDLNGERSMEEVLAGIVTIVNKALKDSEKIYQ